MAARVRSSPAPLPASLPPRPRSVVLDDLTRVLTMPRDLRPSPAMTMPRRPIPLGRDSARAQGAPMPAPVMALVDELSDLLALDEQRAASSRMRPNEFAKPSWCTHEGVTVTRGGRRACLRCGAVLG